MPDAAAPPNGASFPHNVDADNASPSVARPRVVIVSSVRLFREGLAELAARARVWHSVVTAQDAAEVRSCMNTAEPTVALIDASDTDALELARYLARARSVIGVIAFAATDDVEARLLLAEAGVCGYVSREGSIADVMEVVEKVRLGELDCSPRLAAALARRLAKLADSSEVDHRAELLSYREREIVRLIDRGMSNKEIARVLKIEVATVKNHIHHILHKLGVHRRGEAAAILRRWHGAVSGRRAEFTAAPTRSIAVDRK